MDAVNGGHDPFSSRTTRRLPEYPGSGFIGMALIGLFVFVAAKIGWRLALELLLGAWHSF
jgi:hypothetical protein